MTLLPVAAVADEGATLYALHCSSCHGADGRGSTVGPSLIGAPASDVHFMLDTGRMPAAVPEVNELHKAPIFTELQIDEIVRYVTSLSPHPDTALPVLGPGDPTRGRRLFAANCAACHGPVGEGDSVGAENVAPSLGNATVFQVAEAIRAGPGVMPRFGRDVLSDRDVDDIARYVNYVQTEPSGPATSNAWGAPLARLGPVAEGFVAWLFGIGTLVLFVRKIGSTQ
jgi:ubiquinol-cytochrome c reductase cytochrome c subunit